MTLKELMNEQIINIKNELEVIEDPVEKIKIRMNFVELLSSIECDNEELPEIPDGKEAIKSDVKKKKKTTKKKVEETPKEEVVEDTEKDEIPFPNVETDFNNEDLQNTGIELHEEVSETPAPTKTEIMINGIDCAEIYNMLPHDLDEEIHQEIAYEFTTAKEIFPLYQELISESKLSHSVNVARLASHLYNNDLETINYVLSEFSDGTLNNIYEDLNDSNVEAFVDHIDMLINQQEEE